MITVCDLNPDVIAAAEAAGFSTLSGNIMAQSGVLVSPANSFGFMDGGIDAVYERAYPGTQDEVQKRIRDEYDGELPVENAFWIALPGIRHSHLIVAPTMRTPATDLRGTLNAYLAMRAVIGVYKKMTANLKGGIDSEVSRLLVPGLGTASGRMNPRVALWQMKVATLGQHEFDTWHQAKNHEISLLQGI